MFWVRLPLATNPALALGHDPGCAVAVRLSHTPTDVLCIEGNPTNLRLIEGIFAPTATSACSARWRPALGLELARTHRPALILLDINLPDMDGYAVMQCLREHEATRDIPVLAMSANARPEDIERSKAAGFVAYLTKPLDGAELLRTVSELLAARPRP